MAGLKHRYKDLIYIVDDCSAYRSFLEIVLRKHGYRVASFEAPCLALNQIEEDIPNLILSDIEMPVMDGFKFYLEVKMNPLLSSIPFLFISSTDCEQHHNTAQALTHMNVLRKPTPYTLLIESIERFLSNRNLHSQKPHLA